nr:fusion protein [Avian orthoavulavirus 13]
MARFSWEIFRLSTILLITQTCQGSIDGRLTLAAGIVPVGDRPISIYTSSQTGIIVVKLIPNLPDNKKDCAKQSLQSYNETLSRILTPLATAMSAIRGNSTTQVRENRLVGAIIGSVALGVATAAQITAATALIQANQNAANIARLANSIAKTNEAVTDLTEGLGTLAVGVGKLQDYVNEQFNNTAVAIDCLTLESRLGIQLSLYLTELMGVFGNQLTSPALTPITIQALYNLAGGNLNALLSRLGASETQLGSLINSGLIKGMPIMYDDANKLLAVQVELPSIGKLNGARSTLLETLAVDTTRGPSSPIIPNAVIEIGGAMEELDLSPCITTDLDMFCTKIISYPLSQSTLSCLNGNLSDCVFSRSEGVLSTPYMTIKGKIVANCKQVICRCMDPPQILSQNYGEALLLIDENTCRSLELSGVILKLAGTYESEYTRNLTVDPSQVIITGPLDISAELSKVNQSIDSAKENIAESNKFLSQVNVKLLSSSAMITYIVATVVCLIIAITGCVIGIYTLTKLKSQQKTLLWLGNNAEMHGSRSKTSF